MTEETELKCEDCGSTENTYDHFHFPSPPYDNQHTLCLDCAEKAGFCMGCHNFFAGLESFDFSPIQGFCSDCVRDIEQEQMDEHGEDYWVAFHPPDDLST